MRRALALVVLLFLTTGCATEADKAQWGEFWKDVRGDNMKMQSDRELGNRPASSRSDD
jgi:hypothetical protein